MQLVDFMRQKSTRNHYINAWNMAMEELTPRGPATMSMALQRALPRRFRRTAAKAAGQWACKPRLMPCESPAQRPAWRASVLLLAMAAQSTALTTMAIRPRQPLSRCWVASQTSRPVLTTTAMRTDMRRTRVMFQHLQTSSA